MTGSPRAAIRSAAAALLPIALVVAGCERRGPWDCRALGPTEECTASAKVAPPGPGWACHEWRGVALCAAPGRRAADARPAGARPASAGTAARAAPAGPGWTCREDGGDTLCRSAPLPALPPAPPDTRAGGAGAWRCRLDADGTRRCRPRAFGNGDWRCDGGACAEPYPDRPSRWEWECFESYGRTVCRSLSPAAATDPAWTCTPAEDGRQDGGEARRVVCVDPDPDVPDDAPAGWSCRHHETRDGARRCTPGGAPICDADGQCRGGFCQSGRCVLGRLTADCYFPADCPPGSTCVGGTCRH